MSDKPKPSSSDPATDPFFDAAKDPELERKVDAMMGFDTVDEPAETPVPEPVVDVPEVAKVATPIVVVDYSDVEKTGAPILPINKTSAFKKKIAVTDDTKAEDAIPVTKPKKPLPADNELEPFEAPEPEIEPIEEVALGETEAEVAPVPDPVEIARQRVSQLPEPSDDLGLESASTSKAVDEIIAAEADELLIARDKSFNEQLAEVDSRKQAPKKHKKSPGRFKKVFIRLVVFMLLAGIGAAAAIPASRYAVLNAAGVRVSSSIIVLDETNGQPIKNVDFTISGTTAKTDADGKAALSNLKLGKNKMTLKKPAFAEQSQDLVLGWGSNPLGESRIKAVGSQYTIVVTDFLSKKPIAKVDAASGDANARSNDQGKIVLAIPQADTNTVDVELTLAGYRKEIVKIDLSNTKETNVSLVPDRKQAFISKRAGTFDLYKIDVDGKNEEKILSGTGRERSETIALAIHSTRNVAALVSTREASLKGIDSPSTLTLINLDDNSATAVTQSPRVQLVDWIGDKLIYVKIGQDEAENSTKRHKLISYDITTKTERELASTNYFNDVAVAKGSIYYAPAAHLVNGSVGLYKINAEGNYRKSIFDKEVWNLFRTSYDKLSVSIGEEWFELALDTDAMVNASAPVTLKSRTYLDSFDGKTSLWTEERDGKGVLLAYDKASKTDKIIQTQSGLKNPIRWIDSTHIIYRVSNTSEIADYILSTDGEIAPIKIKDVTDTAGIDRWYYY